jgi:uncharacterized protein (TIGR02996 family)
VNHQAFLGDIIEHPDDDAPRLVYADWLEDNGDSPRAEFIRVQCERARLPQEDDRHAELEARERRLVLKHADKWVSAELPLSWTEFRRGFPEALAPSPSWLTDEQVDSLGPLPIRDLRLYGHDGELDTGRIREMPLLEQIEFLRVGDAGDPVSSSEIRELLGSERLTRLRSLDLYGNGLDSRAVNRLLEIPVVQQLETLYLGANGINDGTLQRLVALPWPNLRRLGVGHNNLTSAGFEALMRSDLWPRLEEIDLGMLPREDLPLTLLIEAIERMQAKVLCVSALPGSSLVPALCQACSWGPLKSLILGHTSFAVGVFERLLGCPHLAGLRELYLSGYPITAQQAALLAACPHLKNLARLSVEAITPLLGPLARSRHLTGLQRIVGWGSEDDVIDFVASENADHLRWLFVPALGLSDRVVEALAGSPHMGRLTTLAGTAGLSDWGAEMIARSPHLKNLTCLGLITSQLSATGMQALLEAEHLGWVGIEQHQLKKDALRRLWRARYGDGERVALIDNGLVERL